MDKARKRKIMMIENQEKEKNFPKNPDDIRVNSEVKLYDWWNINLVKNVSKEK